MRSQPYITMSFIILQKISDEVFKGQLTLRKWPLMNGRQYLPVFNQGNQIFIKIRRNQMYLIKQIQFIQGPAKRADCSLCSDRVLLACFVCA